MAGSGVTKRIAEAWLRDALQQARRGTLAGMVRTRATFADAAADYLRYVEHDRGRKPWTLRGYRSGDRGLHDLRHTVGTRMIAKADIRRVQEWMGHADIQTTMRYLHYAPRPEDAALVGPTARVGVRRAYVVAGSPDRGEPAQDIQCARLPVCSRRSPRVSPATSSVDATDDRAAIGCRFVGVADRRCACHSHRLGVGGFRNVRRHSP